ncbi:WD40/YVTN repeat domain containing superfamily protein [Babesia gibsoni]|uniref:WD40/YVTN repeat domain containing superfamily protein n=1 Tax=Babesia gibsoni TaxID=33632 RepID=A0AAD8PGJ1_BABGI|nr:WD40/YVTN repeat domain containing superfamily protein [Babesia gibsoni]
MVELLSSFQKRAHRNCITSLGSDGGKVASGGKDSCVQLYDCTSGGILNGRKFQLETVANVKTNVICVDLVGNRAICGTSCGQLHIMDALSGTTDRILAHKSQINCVKWLDASRHVVCTVSSDGKAKVWDIRHTSIPVHELIGHTSGVNFCDSFPNAEKKDDLAINFGDYYERVLTVGSDRTARLWNLNSGTHLAFKVPQTLSQNVECCSMLLKKPHYIFAVGMDSEYILVFSVKLKNHIGMISLGGCDVWVTCLRTCGEHLLAGTNIGKLFFLRYAFNSDHTECSLEIECTFTYDGSINDIRAEVSGDEVTLYLAIGSEIRLGRWAAFTPENGERPKNLINRSQFRL